jgi:hypothetical protein
MTNTRRWRPRFTVRSLLIGVTLLCAYAACWGPTKTRGVRDVVRFQARHIGFDFQDKDAVRFAEVFGFNAAVPLPLIVALTHPGAPPTRKYYLWLYGYVAKLPYERRFSEDWTTLSGEGVIVFDGIWLQEAGP